MAKREKKDQIQSLMWTNKVKPLTSWRSEGLRVRKSGGLKVWGFWGSEVWGPRGLKVWGSGDLGVWRSGALLLKGGYPHVLTVWFIPALNVKCHETIFVMMTCYINEIRLIDWFIHSLIDRCSGLIIWGCAAVFGKADQPFLIKLILWR